MDILKYSTNTVQSSHHLKCYHEKLHHTKMFIIVKTLTGINLMSGKGRQWGLNIMFIDNHAVIKS